MGQVHGTYTDFNSYGNWGFRYMQGGTNGPGTGASQYYGMTIGLGNEYSNYGSQFYWNRTSTGGNPYVSVRFLEGGSWGSWSKIYAGYADSAGSANSVAWTNVSSRPTNLSQFTNDLGNYGGWITSGGQANSISPNYAGGVQSNPQVYFNNGIGLKVAMTGHWSVWSDTVWVNGYTGSDVPWMCALHFLRNSEPRFAISAQTHGSGSYGSIYEVITGYNIGSQSVSYASTAGNANSISAAVGGAYTWTNVNYFRTNQGGYCGSLDSGRMQAYSDSNNSAFFSWHKGGHYATNMGLDADNVIRIGGWSASANRLQLDMSGNLTLAGDVTAYSDIRVKTNIQTIENALEKTLALRGVSYNRTDSDDKKTKIGVIAQETLPIVPEVVNQDNDGMYNVSYGNFAGLFIEAIKELNAKIAHLEAQLASK
jgi:hypothetical protein